MPQPKFEEGSYGGQVSQPAANYQLDVDRTERKDLFKKDGREEELDEKGDLLVEEEDSEE